MRSEQAQDSESSMAGDRLDGRSRLDRWGRWPAGGNAACLACRHDADRREPASSWGLDGGEDVWLPRDITLPWLTGTKVWQVKVRRATVQPRDTYASIRGGHPLLYGADTLVPNGPAVMTEGEIDTLLVWQTVGDRTAAVSLGSASRRPTRLERCCWLRRIQSSPTSLRPRSLLEATRPSTSAAAESPRRTPLALFEAFLRTCPPARGVPAYLTVLTIRGPRCITIPGVAAVRTKGEPRSC